ncbi:heterokaryon incompatibility protein [Colletotrichum truncatum]|uniref:Heterokaryon incompatibility protein n=1 Tax=Colletotrichum truncatum TaxID=5467 RepID=A0ACC3YDG4_COLTU|nr:heterokaryon incompatibility protein [Colletotrichum truncatum]KAF6783087.1 heterokaryon incompatibility protein [Colletotrichum truncatum]
MRPARTLTPRIFNKGENWTGHDIYIEEKYQLAKIDNHDWIPEDTRERIRSWGKTKTNPAKTSNPGKNQLYKPIIDPYEMRVLEVKAGSKDEELKGSLHHCSVEYKDPGPKTRGWYTDTIYALSMDDLTVPVTYTALSYTWGPPVFEGYFECDGHGMAITKSLESALRHFRDKDHSVVMWIDQICIDQSNMQEKLKQIPLMPRIYRHAVNTVIWLGDSNERSAIAFRLLEEIYERLQFTREDNVEPQDLERYCLPKADSSDWEALWDLLSRQWFTRVWIIQEVTLSKNPFVVCGEFSVSWEDIASACMQLATTGISKWLSQKSLKVKKPVDDREDVYRRVWQLDLTKYATKINPPNLFYIMVDSRNAQCYDSRDKVYGLLGICNEHFRDALTVSYADDFPAARLYHAVILEYLSYPYMGGLDSILASVDHDSPHLPSWVPDFSKPRQTVSLGYTTASRGIYRACGRFTQQFKKIYARVDRYNDAELHVRGIFFDTIVEISPLFEDPDITCIDPETENKTLLEIFKFISQLQRYPAPNTVFSTFWRTIVAGKNGLGREKCPESFAEIVSLLLDTCTGKSPSLPGQTYSARQRMPKDRGRLDVHRLNGGKPGSPGHVFQDFRWAMINANRHRRLGFTSKGYLCLFPRYVDIGDQVFVLESCAMPFIMRTIELDRKSFRLIGECYVCGIMDGEAIRPNVTLEEIVLV